MRHAPRESLPRHLHDHAFAAVVLSGGYVEAGDTGRHWMEAGDVLLHQSWESHLDRFDGRGAEVLVLAPSTRSTTAAAAVAGWTARWTSPGWCPWSARSVSAR